MGQSLGQAGEQTPPARLPGGFFHCLVEGPSFTLRRQVKQIVEGRPVCRGQPVLLQGPICRLLALALVGPGGNSQEAPRQKPHGVLAFAGAEVENERLMRREAAPLGFA